MFKIERINNAKPKALPAEHRAGDLAELLPGYCAADSWSADLSSGLFSLGDLALRYHGLPEDSGHGLLSLIQRYDPAARENVTDILEEAASAASRFCFSTFVNSGDSRRQPIICIGESFGHDSREGGRMCGIFLFPAV